MMFDIFKKLNEYLVQRPPVTAVRLPTFYPSAASCIDKTDGVTPIGACIRAQYFRCAGIPVSNPNTAYSEWIFAAGNLWEDYLTEQMKQMGYWLGNSIKFSIPEYYISGEVDIVVRNYLDGSKWIIENKTFSSANYQQAKSICGFTKGAIPRYKDQNLLQAFLYLFPFRGEIAGTSLTYMDRACGGEENYIQFDITENGEGTETSPEVLVRTRDGIQTWVDKRITMQGIFDRYSQLMDYLVRKEVPPPDYEHVYTEEKVEKLFESGEIAKTKYQNYKKNPIANPIGDWQCSYCSHRDYCKNLLEGA